MTQSQKRAGAGKQPLPGQQGGGRVAKGLAAASRLLSSRHFCLAAKICNEIIDGGATSDAQRIEARRIRGKALISLGQLPAAAFDFYKALEADRNDQEAFGYILQIEADTGLPLTKASC